MTFFGILLLTKPCVLYGAKLFKQDRETKVRYLLLRDPIERTKQKLKQNINKYPSYFNHAQYGNKEYLKYEQELNCETLSESSIV